MKQFMQWSVAQVLVVTSLVVLSYGWAHPVAAQQSRLGGQNRYETAALVAEQVKRDGLAGTTALLTTGENFPDAVVAGAWQEDAVILLTTRHSIPEATLRVLGGGWIRNVVVVGGPAVISDDVVGRVRSLNIEVNRVYGDDRYATSLAVSRAGFTSGSVSSIWIASGTRFVDQLIAGAGARRTGGGFLITRDNSTAKQELLDEVQRLTGGKRSSINVIDSGSTLATLSIPGHDVVRRTGDPFSVGAVVQASGSVAVVASGENWPDALGSLRLLSEESRLVLTRQWCSPNPSRAILSSASSVVIVGGPAAVRDVSITGRACGTPVIASYTSPVYSNRQHWLCRPDMADTCDDDTSVTHVAADGKLTVESFKPNESAPVDCFYLYPTSSEDQTLNSDYIAGNERNLAFAQAARFSGVCRVFAPVYRSVTLAGLMNPNAPGDRAMAWITPLIDIIDAWRHYLANDNYGRGVILIGHSQGSTHFVNLFDQLIDHLPEQRRLIVSAVLLGATVDVPPGKDMGGVLQNIPLCRSDSQFGCIVTYAAFRDNAPPTLASNLGRSLGGPSVRAGCTNPGNLVGGRGSIEAAFRTSEWAFADGSGRQKISTPFMSFPGLLSAECASLGDHSYLKVFVDGKTSDPRVDDIQGDLGPENGLHSFDVELSALTLVDLVANQAAEWMKKN
jgi:hypothetical protein